MDYELVVVALVILGSPIIANGYKLWLRWIIVPRRFEFIEGYTFDTALRNKFSEVYPDLSSHEVERVFDGLLQFFKIAHRAQKQRIAMPSRVVDDAWHQFILFTADYAHFCKQRSSWRIRWKVECFHKSLKSEAALAKSPTKRVRTQSNHVFMALYAAFQIECLRVRHHMKHFALRAQLYRKAIRTAFDELQKLKTA